MRLHRCLARFVLCAPLLVATTAGSARAQATAREHQYTNADIRGGGLFYRIECELCDGANGDGVDGIDLRLGQFKRPMSDDELGLAIQKGNPDAGMPAFSFEPDELMRLVAYIRAGFDSSGAEVQIGDAERGRALFEGKGACMDCHRVNGRGPRAAPDLSDIGAVRTPAGLERKLLDPSSAMMPIHRPVTIVTRDGRTIRGRRLNEDTYTLQVIDSEERLVSILKNAVKEYEISNTSLMPEAPLSNDELADVIGYLLTLRGQP